MQIIHRLKTLVTLITYPNGNSIFFPERVSSEKKVPRHHIFTLQMHTRARTNGRERRELGFRSNRRSPGKLELNFAKSYVTHVGYLRLSRRNVSFFPLVEIGDNYLPSTRSERTSPLSPPPLLISISFRIFPVSTLEDTPPPPFSPSPTPPRGALARV